MRESDIKARFMAAYNRLLEDRERYLAACRAATSILTDTSGIDAELDRLLSEMEVVSELTRKCVMENSTTVQDQAAFTKRYNGYVEQYEKAKARYDDLQKTKEALLSSENNLRLANSKAEDLSIKRLTRNAPSVRAMFEEIRSE